MPRVIGLTGGIASGKSTVAGVLRRMGIPVVDADEIAREVVQPGQPASDAIRREFGDGVFDDAGRLDRAALGARVFAAPELRARLEAITHPAIAQASGQALRQRLAEGHEVVVYEAALLVETGRYRDFDALVVVTAPESVQLERLAARDGLDEAAGRARLAAQLPMADKVAVADALIVNDGDLSSLEAATRRALEDLS